MHPGSFKHRSIGLVLLVTLALAWPQHASASSSCFSATGQCIGVFFSNYWPINGGLPVFGYPTTTVDPEINPDTNATYLTQWFERNRLESHPEMPVPFTVLLGRLGDERLKQQGRDWTTFPKANPAAPHYFAVTGHAIAPQFWSYWSSHGLDLGDPGVSFQESLGLFGYPLSEPAMETNSSGDNVLTQWFERARFEYHPQLPAPFTVLLGLLGNEVHAAQAAAPVPFYESRNVAPERFLISYYNAINRHEYQRAYNYWESPNSLPPFAQFAAGYATTAFVELTVGAASGQGAAGSVFADIPTVLVVHHTDASREVFFGCYTVRHTNPGIDPNPDATLWRVYSAKIQAAPAGATAATALPAVCSQ